MIAKQHNSKNRRDKRRFSRNGANEHGIQQPQDGFRRGTKGRGNRRRSARVRTYRQKLLRRSGSRKETPKAGCPCFASKAGAERGAITMATLTKSEHVIALEEARA